MEYITDFFFFCHETDCVLKVSGSRTLCTPNSVSSKINVEVTKILLNEYFPYFYLIASDLIVNRIRKEG